MSDFRDAGEFFAAAVDLPPAKRQEFVERESRGDTRLRDEVLSLLRHHESSADFMQRPAVLDALGDAAAGTLPETIGAYRILSVIGEGGMGVVYRAHHETLARDVAIKVIRPGFATESAQKRFVREVRLLGMLQHPGIGRIYETGTASVAGIEMPFLVMELVQGVAITEHAERAGLDARARLELFALVCDAVEHAHRQGIVHRDLKPANILVDVGTARPIPKVLDFGIARQLEEDPLGAVTRTGQLVGTLAYMAPEVVQSRSRQGHELSPDVYSLGVVLHELLSGRLPLELAGLPLPEAARRIAEGEPTPPSRFDPRIAADVDTLVAKALAKDPRRRYASAGELAADVRRFLADEPIEARPPSTLYRLEKFTRRNRALVGGAAATFLVLAAGTVVSSVYAVRAGNQRDRAVLAEQRERERAEEKSAALAREQAAHARAEHEQRHSAAVSKYFRELIAEVVPGARGPETTLADLLESARGELPGPLAGAPDVELEVRSVLGQSLSRLGRDAEGERELRAALALAQGPAPLDPLELADLKAHLGGTLLARDALDDAEPLLVEAQAVLAAGEGAASVRALGATIDLATLRRMQGRDAEAKPMLESALAIARAEPRERAEPLCRALRALGLLAFDSGRLEAAEELQSEARELALATFGEVQPSTLGVTSELACTLQLRDKLDESLALHERAVELGGKLESGRHPSQIARLNNLASALTANREFQRAVRVRREAVALAEDVLGAEHQNTWTTRENYAVLIAKGGTVDEAESILRDVLARERARFGTDDRRTLETLHNLVWLLREEQKYEEALALGDELVEHAETTLAAGDWKRSLFRAGRGILRLRAGAFEGAEQDLLAANEAYVRLLGDSSAHTQSVRRNLAKLYEAWNKPDEAERWR